MPFGPYKDWDDCIQDQKSEGKSEEKAARICGALQRDLEGEEKNKNVLYMELSEEEQKLFEEKFNPEKKVEAFILEDDSIKTSSETLKGFQRSEVVSSGEDRAKRLSQSFETFNETVSKALESTQSSAELRKPTLLSMAPQLGTGLKGYYAVDPPYDPELLALFLELDETHARCCQVKATDSVGRSYKLDPIVSVKPEGQEEDGKETSSLDSDAVDASIIREETKRVQDFIRTSNKEIGLMQALFRAASDYEAIGWAALEIVRSRNGKVKKIHHIPATRIRVIEDWKGFVEVVESSTTTSPDSTYVYYQAFGDKVIRPNQPELTPYDPVTDGEFKPGTFKWNMIDKETGEPTDDFERAANEVVWVPKSHSNTIYYGYSDLVSAVGWALANANIRDYLLQFFENNCVPRYAIIVEGADIDKDVKELIQKFFTEKIKGKAHSTLLIPVPSLKGEVTVRFEKLDADKNEGSFQDTKKNNAQSIMTAHGVSPAIIGIAEAANLGSGKGLSQAEIYKDRIVTPNQQRWQGVLDQIFRLGLGIQYVSLVFEPLDIRDLEAEQRVLTEYLNKGIYTINEVRKRLGKDPIPGGDRAFILTNPGILYFVDAIPSMEGMINPREMTKSDSEEKENPEEDSSDTPENSEDSNGEGE